MNLFKKKKNDDSRGRRSSRLLMLRLRKLGFFTAFLALAGALVFTGYHTGSFGKIGSWITQKTLAQTSAAGFRVRDILVTGRVHIPAQELLARFSIKQNMPIFGVDIASAQKSLTGISWVKDVSVSRRLPDTIVVALQERKPAALWQYQKKISLIDKEGVVLATEDLGAWQQLPLVVGEDAPRHIAALTELLTAEPQLAAQLAAAVRVEGRRWDLRLQNGIAVKLPEQDTELAVRRLMTLEEKQNILGRNLTVIDLRLPEKMMVTPVAAKEEPKDKKNEKKHI